MERAVAFGRLAGRADDVLIARQDQFSLADIQRRVSADRPGIAADDIDDCHAMAPSHPKQLAERLTAYLLH